MSSANERQILRKMAGKIRAIADLPEMEERKKRWLAHNALEPGRPLVLCFPEGAWVELVPEASLECRDPLLRGWERTLRQKLFWWERIRDDHVLEPFFNLNWRVEIGDFGVTTPMFHGENRGSYRWDPPVKDIDRDFSRLHFRALSVDREGTRRDLELAQEIFGDFLAPRLQGTFWWTLGLTQTAIKLIGLEPLMLLPYDAPDQLHRLMRWLMEEQLHFVGWLEKEGLLTLNNGEGYTGSGGVAYTRELPQRDWKPGMPVRTMDLWGFAESQETVGVSPAMFAEFIFPYQLPLLEKFGLNCYGCCEALHLRWDTVSRIPRLRRVSVSPWCDQAVMAEKLGRNYIFSRKPNPSLVCMNFNEEVIRRDLRETLGLAGKGVLEIILKDTHTVENDPSRISRWVKIALEEVEKHQNRQ